MPLNGKTEQEENRKEGMLHDIVVRFYSSAPKKDLVADQPALDFSVM